jgi:hypothetical protein
VIIPDLERARTKRSRNSRRLAINYPRRFEAKDPRNWPERKIIQPFESTLRPPKRWLEDDFVLFKDEDSGFSSSSSDSVEFSGVN